MFDSTFREELRLSVYKGFYDPIARIDIVVSINAGYNIEGLPTGIRTVLIPFSLSWSISSWLNQVDLSGSSSFKN